MYDEIVKCIEEDNWSDAIKNLSLVLSRNEFNEDVAVLAATIFIGTDNMKKARDVIGKGLKINYKNYELWLLLGQSYECENVNQAYLCYENALFYCDNEADAQIIQKYIARAEASERYSVRRSAIVILSYNSLEYTRQCIESIRSTCPSSAYEIIVVDNASADNSVAWLMEQPDIKLKCNSENVGFPGGCNQGIALAEEDSDIFLLNNDTVMADNSLFWLRMGLYENDCVGAAGAVSNCVSNLQQVTWNCTNLECYLSIARENNLLQRYPYCRRNWLIGFALLIKRNCLEEIGYLDERFTPGQYEDNDIGLRLSKAGYELILCRNSFIFHFGSGGGKNLKKWTPLLQKNKLKIQEKWGFEFDNYIYPDFKLLAKVGSYGSKPIRVMHIGSGIGATLLILKDFCPNAQLYGIETDENMIEVTPRSINMYRCDVLLEELPLEKDFFDIIMCGEKYEKSIKQAEFRAKVMEYLKVGGRFMSYSIDIKKGEPEENPVKPLVSVLMPCYNHGKYVGNAIESILSQTYPNIELIVADNGSTDNSFAEISKYKDKIKILRLEKNNLRLCGEMLREVATGEYIASATADDEWMPEKVDLQMAAFFSNPNLQVCFTWAVYADENLQVFQKQENNVFLVKNRPREEWMRRFIYGGNCLCYPSALYKREMETYFASIRKGYIQLGDFYRWLLVIQKGDIYVVEKPMVKFRWHTNGNNRNSSAPSMETTIRTNQEYAEIVLRILESMEDCFFRDAFQKDFINSNAQTHKELLCEKFFLLKRMAERSFFFSENVIVFYHSHYLEIEEILENEYGFSSGDFSKLCACSGLSYACVEVNRLKALGDVQKEYISSYINISQELAKETYSNGFIGSRARVIFHMLPETEQTNLRTLHRLCVTAVKIITENAADENDIYCEQIDLVLRIYHLMDSLRKQTKLLGIMCDDEEFGLFDELVHLGKKNKLNLQEAVIPYIQIIIKQLREAMD